MNYETLLTFSAVAGLSILSPGPAILLALRETHPKEFLKFAQATRRDSPMVMRILDRLGDRNEATT